MSRRNWKLVIGRIALPKAQFVTYGGGHINMLLPVIRELRKHDWEIGLLALTTASATSRQAGIPFKGFRDYVGLGDRSALEWGMRLAETMHAAGLGIEREESVAYLGLSMQELVEDVGAEEAERRVGELGRWAFLPRRTMRRILETEKPDVVITTNSPRAEYATILAAQDHDIPSVMILDLFGRFRAKCMSADFVCVLSEMTRDNLVDLGQIDPARIRVTGNPAFDRWAEVDLAETRKAVRARLGIPASAPLALLALEPIPQAMPMVTAMLGWLEQEPEAWLFVRQHPNRSPESVATAVQNRARAIAVPPGRVSLPDALAPVDVVVTASSTVGVEACLLDKPLVSLQLEAATADDAPYAELGLALGAADPADLPGRVSEALYDASARARLAAARARLPRRGTAASAVVEVLQEAVPSLKRA